MKVIKGLSELTCETTTVTVPLYTNDGRPIALLVGKSLSCVDVSKFIIYPIIYDYDDYKTSYIIPTGIDIYVDIGNSIDIKSYVENIYEDITIRKSPDNNPYGTYKICIDYHIIYLNYSDNSLKVEHFERILEEKVVSSLSTTYTIHKGIIDNITVDILDINTGHYYCANIFNGLDELKIEID